MRVLDLFSGLCGWSNPFRSAGHEVWTLDNDPQFNADDSSDILSLPDTYAQGYDVVLASPPCTCFSTMTFGRNWKAPGVPKRPEAQVAMDLVNKAVRMIQVAQPKFWVIENPRAMLRKLDLIPGRRETVWYCRYGESRAKPTDLWGGFPSLWRPRPACKNGHPDHTPAPRGSRTGTQGGVSAGISAKIPFQLATELRLAMEREMAKGNY